MRPTTTLPGAPVLDRERVGAALFDALPTAIVVRDPKTREFRAANRAWDELGLTPEPSAGLEPGTVSELRFPGPNGRSRPLEVATHAVLDDDGETVLLFQLITDLSERRHLQEQLVQSGKLAAIGELAAGVAHEINNPLFAILGLTEFLLKDAPAASKQRERLELIQETGVEIKEIVAALLDFARESPNERHELVLEDAVRKTVDLVRRTNAYKGVELRERYDGSRALVNGSSGQLKQVILNLIANARQAIPQSGTVRIEVRRDGEHVVASVTDDGPGIEPELLGRIFEPFFTTRRRSGGTGLGLSAALGIAESHGGTLTVASKPGAGAAFTLRLPTVDAEEVSQ
jgi:two-component system NtrC family sensor kinase